MIADLPHTKSLQACTPTWNMASGTSTGRLADVMVPVRIVSAGMGATEEPTLLPSTISL